MSDDVILTRLLKNLGYTTIWISNQEQTGVFGSPIALIGEECEYSYFSGDLKSSNVFGKPADEQILSKIPCPQVHKTAIFLHLWGNHYPYAGGKFSDRKEFSAYEQSLRSVDDFLQKAFEKVQKDKFDVVVYFSDHGEYPSYGTDGHNVQKLRKEMIHVPFWIYLSDAFAEKLPELSERLKNAQKQVITNDLIFNIICDILNIRGPKIQQGYNPLSDQYIINLDNAKTKYGKSLIKDLLDDKK